MAFWHMQIHPGDPDNAKQHALDALSQNVIGLDFEAFFPNLQDLPLNEWTEHDFEKVKAERIRQKGSEGVTGVLKDFATNIRKNDIILIRAGATPLALVKVKADYQFVPDGDLWFSHRYPIKILGWYKNLIAEHPELDFTPPSQGTLQKLTNENSQTYMGIHKWLRVIKMDNSMNELLDLLTLYNQIILQGPPGTGKTYMAKQLAVAWINGQPFSDNPKEEFSRLSQNGQAEIVQFHPSYNYEDFVRGIQVSTNDKGEPDYRTENRIFAEIAERAANEDGQKFVLLIDEINRANLAAVLGELIYALEYRGETVHTPYAVDGQNYQLSVPTNLFIIGTMNTSDRSIGNIDYAVRRRFAFVPCLPAIDVLNDYPAGKALFSEVEKLFKGEGACLSPDFYPDDVQPGHTYFMSEGEDLARRFAYQVYPLLREYFKDGILVMQNNELAIKFDEGDPIEIHRQMPAREVFEIVLDWAT